MAYTYGTITHCKVRNGQTRNEYELRLGYQLNSQSIENNTSNITLRLECRSTSSSYSTKASSGLTTVIDGTTVKSNAAVDMSHTNVWQNFGERTITVAHNTDGTYSTSKSGSFTCTAGSSQYSLSSGSASVTVAPATIPRATTPTLSSSSVNLGSSVTISTPRASSSFTHTLTYKFGNASGTIANNVATSQSWTPPLSLANQIPNATSGTCTITCKTYDGSTLIGEKTVSLTLSVPSNVVPTINSVTVSEGNQVMINANWGIYVQSRSQLRVVTNATGTYGSTITAYRITGIDSNTYNSRDFISNVLTQSGNKTITIQVTDSRGRTASTTRTYTCQAYQSPSVSSASAERCLADGTLSDEGTYLKYSFYGSIYSLGGKNPQYVKIGYRQSGSGSYTYKDVAINVSNQVLANVTFSADNAYDIQFYVADYFTNSTVNRILETAFQLINFNASGKAMAIGKVSEADSDEEVFEIAMPIRSNSRFNRGSWNGPTKGLITQVGDNSGTQHSPVVGLKSDGETRNYGIDFLNSDANPRMRIYSGSNFLEIADTFKFNTKNVAFLESGTWTPQLTNTGDDGEPSVTYDYQNGSYFKIGTMVVCLFRFRGKITALGGSNYAGIKGLPYSINGNVLMSGLSSVYNLLTRYGGGELTTMPTIVVKNSSKIQIQSGEALGSTTTQFKLSGSNSFECFGGVIYQTN